MNNTIRFIRTMTAFAVMVFCNGTDEIIMKKSYPVKLLCRLSWKDRPVICIVNCTYPRGDT